MRPPNLTWRGYVTALAVAVLGGAGQWLETVSPLAWLPPAVLWVLLLAWEGRRCRRDPPALWPALPATLRLGRDEPIGLDMEGRASWRQAVEVAWPLPGGLSGDNARRRIVLRRGHREAIRWRVRGRRLGVMVFGDVYLRITGPLGLSRWIRRVPLEETLRVVPDVLSSPVARSGRGRQGERGLPRPGSGTELHGLRAYWPGDPLRAVDWKATARRGQPMVRLFDDQQALELLILLDVGRASGVSVGPLSRLHHFINIAARLAEAGGQAGDRIGGLCYAAGVTNQAPMVSGVAGVRRWRRILQAQRSLNEESNPLLAALQARHMLSHRGLVVFLTDLTDAEAAEQTLQAIALLGRKHLALVGAIVDVEARAMAREPDGGWLAPYRNLAGLELLNAQALLAERLRRLGAHVVLDSPQQLDEALLRAFDQLRRRRAV